MALIWKKYTAAVHRVLTRSAQAIALPWLILPISPNLAVSPARMSRLDMTSNNSATTWALVSGPRQDWQGRAESSGRSRHGTVSRAKQEAGSDQMRRRLKTGGFPQVLTYVVV